MNFLCNDGLKKFAAIFFVLLLAANVSFGIAITTAPLTLQIVGNGTVSPNDNGQSLNVGQSYSLTAKARASFTFAGWSGDATNSKTKLTFVMPDGGENLTATFVDKQKPTLTIKNLPNSTALTNPAVVVTGTARDNDAVATVFCNLNGSGWSAASTGNGWSNWWVNLTLDPNTNVLQIYAVDRSGNFSAISKLKMTYSAAPGSLNGMLIGVTGGDTPYNISFNSGTFSDETGVGSYTYKKSGPVSGKLQLKYTAPPSAVGNDTATLTFSDATDGNFKAADGTSGDFTLSIADVLAPSAVTGANFHLSYTNGANETYLNFLTPPNIVDNGHMFDVANPLVISLDAPYPGNISDRVSVAFTHLVNQGGTYVPVAPRTYTGTVINTDTDNNTATVLFDNPSFLSKSDLYAPTADSPLNILTFYYTNSFDGILVANGTGIFTYSNYGPVGGLLQLNESGTNGFYILTFTSDSTTGNFYVENYGASNHFLNADAGAFDIELPALISNPPQDAAVTNGGAANFYVTANGTPPLAYQWQFNGTDLTDRTNSWGSIVTGSTTTNLMITGVTNNDLGTYQITVSNDFGSASSSANLSLATPPQITSQPASVGPLSSGGTAKFSAVATGSPTLTYQWQFNGVNLSDSITSWSSTISGSLTANLTISNVSTNDAGYYQVIVSNDYGSATNTAPGAQLNVLP
ncbi:MAG TPA: immunoglobulin domain-containing protein [Verrucomicrobiae bacterium]